MIAEPVIVAVALVASVWSLRFSVVVPPVSVTVTGLPMSMTPPEPILTMLEPPPASAYTAAVPPAAVLWMYIVSLPTPPTRKTGSPGKPVITL